MCGAAVDPPQRLGFGVFVSRWERNKPDLAENPNRRRGAMFDVLDEKLALVEIHRRVTGEAVNMWKTLDWIGLR
jgi:hypothetical protein